MVRFASLALIVSMAALAQAPSRPVAPGTQGGAKGTSQRAQQEMMQTLGLVPSMFKALPEAAMAGAWEDFKQLQLSDQTKLSPRHKELIGLAVSAQVPCTYCTYFHRAAAKQQGANERELSEAVAIAALTRKWSTVANGMQLDMASFRQETDKMMRFKGGVGGAGEESTDAQSAYRDMELLFGQVPTELRRYPASSIAGAWKEMKALQLDPNTAIPAKVKELIALGVAAQVPCDYCVYHHTAAARKSGATDAEISEAVAIASMTRHWSTVLNGSELPLEKFQRETDQILSYTKRQTGKRPQ